MISIGERAGTNGYRVEAKTSIYHDYDSRHTLSRPTAKHPDTYPFQQIVTR